MHINDFFANNLYPDILTIKISEKQGYAQSYPHYPHFFAVNNVYTGVSSGISLRYFFPKNSAFFKLSIITKNSFK